MMTDDDDDDLFKKVPSGDPQFLFRFVMSFGVLLLTAYLAFGLFTGSDIGGCVSQGFLEVIGE